MSKNFILKEVTLTGLTQWLNENKKKQTGVAFTTSDTQQYAHKVGHIPLYLGGNEIEVNKRRNFKSTTYNLLE